MKLSFAKPSPNSLPLYLLTAENCAQGLSTLPADTAVWAQANGFTGAAGAVLPLPGPDGALCGALIGLGAVQARERGRFLGTTAASKLPVGEWHIAAGDIDLDEFALGWLLESYRFARYAPQPKALANLAAPDGIDAAVTEAIANGEALTRDLINTPSNDMGPAELEAAVAELAATHDAQIETIIGEDLLAQNFPLIHAVGRAATDQRAPRLIELNWGDTGPRLTLVGKGICFDTGGLNIKPGGSMGLMKKDMGGAAAVLGLASMIMQLGLKLRLRVLIPAAENAIGSAAFRPSDILPSRKGLSVEINNTDAEGRLVLADALAFGAETPPDLMVSIATLTGAARVALGSDIAPFFTDDEAAATALSDAGRKVRDPVWRLPFHTPYEAKIEPGIADLDNAPAGGLAGAITAALFLRRFASTNYIHFDIHGWQPSAAPARPKGGAGQGTRALLAALPRLLTL